METSLGLKPSPVFYSMKVNESALEVVDISPASTRPPVDQLRDAITHLTFKNQSLGWTNFPPSRYFPEPACLLKCDWSAEATFASSIDNDDASTDGAKRISFDFSTPWVLTRPLSVTKVVYWKK